MSIDALTLAFTKSLCPVAETSLCYGYMEPILQKDLLFLAPVDILHKNS